MRATTILLSFFFVLGSLLLANAAPAVPYKELKSDVSSSSGNNDKRSMTYSGKATWFIPSTQGGSIGACGPFEADDAIIVAMNAVQYGDMTKKSSWCGKKLKINHNGKSVVATVNDACPGCAYGSLDLTMPVFQQLGDLDTGVLAITWEEV